MNENDSFLKRKDARKFQNICSDLNNLIIEIRKYMPEACLYVTPGEINILSDPDSRSPLITETVYYMDNGDW